MLFSGIQRFTLLDYPGKIACIAFSPGCNMRCGFCHNMEFVLPERIRELRGSFIPEDAFYAFLHSRIGKLQGVVFSGGEPTQWPDLLDSMLRVKAMGFLVKLDTNGSRPEVLKKALELQAVDAVALDIKTAFSEYACLTDLHCGESVAQSFDILKKSTIWYECRTTMIDEVHSDSILEKLLSDISGAQRYAIQTFRPEHTLSTAFQAFHALHPKRLETFVAQCKSCIPEVIVR